VIFIPETQPRDLRGRGFSYSKLRSPSCAPPGAGSSPDPTFDEVGNCLDTEMLADAADEGPALLDRGEGLGGAGA
jgi:hypothetical protein